MQRCRYQVASPEEIPEGRCAVVSFGTGGGQCALTKQGARYYAFGSLCPHQNAPLQDAPVADGVVTCLRHGYRFSVQTGDCLTIGGYGVPTFPVTVDGDKVYIDVWEDS